MDSDSIKHLEFIQSCIDRMGRNSFMIKGWMLTIAAASIALYANSFGEEVSGNPMFLLSGIIPTFVFWLLDAYYLQQERKFRGIYNDVAQLTEINRRISIKKFEMPLHKYTKGKYFFLWVACSKTIAPLYLLVIISIGVLWCFMS